MARLDRKRFYNAGNKVENRFSYTKADEDPRQSNGVGYIDVKCGPGCFFEVQAEVPTLYGTQTVGIYKEIMEMWGPLGVIMIDQGISDEEAAQEAFIANSDDSARIKGDALWKEHLHQDILKFEEVNNKRRALGYQLLMPQNFVLHAYRALGLQPPAVSEAQLLAQAKAVAPAEDPRLAEMQKKIDQLMEIVTAGKTTEPPATVPTPEPPARTNRPRA